MLRSNPVKLARNLFFLNAAIWIVIGIMSLIRLSDNDDSRIVMFFIMAIMMFGNAGAMALCGWGIARPHKWFYRFAWVVLVVNIILTVTDQFGLLDVITLIIDLVLVGILYTMRSRQ